MGGAVRLRALRILITTVSLLLQNVCGRLRGDLVIVVLAAALSLSSVGAVMRESDQASLLDGSIQLARGAAQESVRDLYNYDKQFFSYWLLAALWKIRSSAGVEPGANNILFAANLFASLIFWGGILFLVSRRAQNRAVSSLLILAALASPAVLLNSPVLCTNIISGGFLALLAGLLGARGKAGWGELLALAVVTFCAVGSRADAVLCLPFLCWVSVRRPCLRRLCASRRHWAMFCGAGAALAAGVAVVGGLRVPIHPPMPILKVIAAFLVFGLGGGLAALALIGGLMTGSVRRAQTLERKLFLAAGLVFFLVPLSFYGFQLYTPRHLVTSALLVLFAATMWRGRALVRTMAAERARIAFAGIIVASAAIPLFLGLRLPEVNRPSLTFIEATRYPTADGLWPMGAYVDFMRRLGRGGEEPIDHNQEVWRSLTSVDLEEVNGVVPVFSNSFLPYFQLAATLQRKVSRRLLPYEYGDFPFLIGDERMLRRSAKPAWAAEAEVGEALVVLKTFPKKAVSAAGAAQPILRVEPGSPGIESDPEVEKRIALAAAFAGNEFNLLGAAAGEFEFRPADRGKTTVFYSEEPFTVILAGERALDGQEDSLPAAALEYDVPSGKTRRLYCATVKAARTVVTRRAIISHAAGVVHVARAVLPEFMSVSKLN